MRLYSQSRELEAIRSICDSKSEEVQSHLLGTLNEDWFHYAPAKAAFSRIKRIARKRGEIMSWSDVISDPSLEEEFREILSESEAAPIKLMKKARSLVTRLDDYRKIRGAYTVAKDVISTLQAESVDVDKLLNTVADRVTLLRESADMDTIVHTLGKGANALDAIDEAMAPENNKLLLTGFEEYDAKTGGLPDEGVMIVASTTSGGKSVMLMNLLMNMYELNNVSTCNLSLEMQKNKNTKRMASKLSGIDFWKFKKGVLSDEERKKAKRAWRKFHEHGDKNDCFYSYICPTFGISIDRALALVRPYGYKVIGIDYAGLLEGTDADEQWKTLSAVVRACKIFSTANHCLVIVLAQLDLNDGRIRYSGGMLEHADIAWKWSYNKPEQRETHIIPVEQFKARDDELFIMELEENFPTMTIRSFAKTGDLKSADDIKAKKSRDEKSGDADFDYSAGQE